MGESSRYASLVLRNNLERDRGGLVRLARLPVSRRRAAGPLGAPVPAGAGGLGTWWATSARIADNDVEALEKSGETGNYRGTDVIGKKGIEKTWETALHGRTGVQEVEVTAGGRPVRTLRRIDPVSGSDIMLSIDMNLQRIVEEAFDGLARRAGGDGPEHRRGAGLRVAALVRPQPVRRRHRHRELEAAHRVARPPAHQRAACNGTYPIGSTYKFFVALAALELGKRSATERVPDPGYFEFGGQKFRNAGGAAYGMTDMHKAIVVSSDTYFYSARPHHRR